VELCAPWRRRTPDVRIGDRLWTYSSHPSTRLATWALFLDFIEFYAIKFPPEKAAQIIFFQYISIKVYIFATYKRQLISNIFVGLNQPETSPAEEQLGRDPKAE